MAGQTPEGGFTDTILICVDCQEEFVFTASAQQYFAERGFTEPPKRCKSCYNDFRKRPPLDADLPGEAAAPMPPPVNPPERAAPGDRP